MGSRISIVDFLLEDVEQIERHDKSPDFMSADIYLSSHRAYTVWIDSEPVAAFGVVEDGSRPGVFSIWMITGKKSGPAMLRLTRFGHREFFPSLPAKRIEAFVLGDFAEAHRWIELLGFACETPDGMANFDGHGNVWFQYARLQ